MNVRRVNVALMNCDVLRVFTASSLIMWVVLISLLWSRCSSVLNFVILSFPMVRACLLLLWRRLTIPILCGCRVARLVL